MLGMILAFVGCFTTTGFLAAADCLSVGLYPDFSLFIFGATLFFILTSDHISYWFNSVLSWSSLEFDNDPLFCNVLLLANFEQPVILVYAIAISCFSAV
jgi:hypothetical protein